MKGKYLYGQHITIISKPFVFTDVYYVAIGNGIGFDQYNISIVKHFSINSQPYYLFYPVKSPKL